MVGQRARGADHPASRCATRTGTGSRATCRPGAGRSSGGAWSSRRCAATAPSSRSSSWSRGPTMPGERVFYGYLRDLTARNVAEAALHRLADEQAALRRVATAVAARATRRGCSTLRQRGGRAAARGRDRAHVPLRPRRARAARSSAAGRCEPEHVLRHGDADADGRRHGRDARVADRPGGADGLLRGRRGRAGGDHARVRRAGRRRRAGLPRRGAVGRGDRLHR